MSEVREPADDVLGDALLADWVAELSERLEAGETVDIDALAETDPERAEQLRRVLPTIRRMTALGRADGPGPGRAGEPSPRSGERGMLGDFRLVREVGRGGMGIVYEAEQVSLNRRVAVKILPPAGALDPRQYQRFLLEARAAACLNHDHVVPVYAVGAEQGVPYYAMQFIDGCTLAEVMDRYQRIGREGEALDPTRADSATPRIASTENPGQDGEIAAPTTKPTVSLGTSHHNRAYVRAAAEQGRCAAEALAHAHDRGIIHRDIKPANLMIDARGHLWVADFGLAQIQGDSRLTLTGDVLGTLRYSSPEQALAKRVVIDGRTDIYSLGATLYELLSLRPLFDSGDRAELLRKIAQDEPTPIRKLNPAVPPDLATIIHKALAKEPSDRYATAREMANDLDRFLDSRPIAARPPGRGERLGKWAHRRRAVVIPVAAVAALALFALGGGVIWSNNWLARHNDRLRFERDRARELSGQLETQRDLAEERRRIADFHLYAFRTRQAADALRARRFQKAQEILRDCRPAPGEDDLRGFAWNYLWRESRKNVAFLSERTEWITSAALAPDGRTLATGDNDGSIRLRDPQTGQLAATWQGHETRVDQLAFSPDGGRFASVETRTSPDGLKSEVLLWEVRSGRPLARFEGLSGCLVDQVGFDARGEHLWGIFGSGPASPWRLGCWDIHTDPARPRFLWGRPREDARPPRADDGPIATIENGGAGFRLRDLVEAARRGWSGSIEAPFGQIAAGSPDGRLLAVGSGAWIVLWDVTADREQSRFRIQLPQSLQSLGFSPDGRFLTVEFHAIDRCEVYDLRTGGFQVIAPVPVDPEPIRAHAFSRDGRFFARSVPAQGKSQPIRVWQLDPFREVASSSGVLEDASTLRFTRDGRSLIATANSAAVRWDWSPPPEPVQPDGHKDEVWAVAFSSDGRLLATGSDDSDEPRTLKLWDAASGQLLRGWKAHEATTAALAFQPGGRVIASAGLVPRENLRLWDAETGGLLATLDGHTASVRSVAFSPDGGTLASAGSDRTIRFWDVASRRCIGTLNGHADTIRQVAFSPDGRKLASVANDSTARLWSTADGTALRMWSGSAKIAGVAFSPDGGILAWVQEDGVIQLRDLVRDQLLIPLHSEYDELRCLAFTADGRTLAAAGRSGRIHLWDPVSGQELLALEGRPSQLNALAFAPDASSLAAGWHDGTVRLVRSRPH